MSSTRFNAHIHMSYHGQPHLFKGAGIDADNLTGNGEQCDGEALLCCQQELHVQGTSDVPHR
jgi:hypothetical protein